MLRQSGLVPQPLQIIRHEEEKRSVILWLAQIEAGEIRWRRDPECCGCVHVRLLHRPEPVWGAAPIAEGIRAVGMALRRDHVAEDTMIEVEGAGEVEKGREV